MNTKKQCWANHKEQIGFYIALVVLGSGALVARVAFWAWVGKPLNIVTITGHLLTALALTLFVAHVALYRPSTFWQYLVAFWARSSLWVFGLTALNTMRDKPVETHIHLFTAMFYAAFTLACRWYKQRQQVP